MLKKSQRQFIYVYISVAVWCCLCGLLAEGQLIRGAGQIKKKTTAAASSPFCVKYQCSCPSPYESIKCIGALANTTRRIDFVEANVMRLDLSDNPSLEMLYWGDTPLNLVELNVRNANISVIHEQMFTKLPHLHLLDLSVNRIAEMKEQYFTSLNVLEKLNLSRAFVYDYKISRDLCELVSLKVADLSYLDLGEFTLECWKTSPHLVELHMRYTRNVEQSASNWLPIIGNESLRLIDLTGSDIKKIDVSQWRNMNNLISLSLSHNLQIDKNSIIELLKSNSLIKQLKYIHLVNISADSKNFPIDQIIKDQKSQIPLQLLDLSNNNFNGDLNSFLFNQVNLSNLNVFRARNNRFSRCDVRLILGEHETPLIKLEELDLGYNAINDSACFYSIKPVWTLKRLDLGHNRLSVMSSDVQAKDFASVFAEMQNLTYVDLSYNMFTSLVFYFNVNHTRIECFDVSNNRLKEFRLLSLTMVNNAKYPFNLEQKDDDDDDDLIDISDDEMLNMQYVDDADIDYEETVIETNNNPKKGGSGGGKTPSDDEDDDERFLVIDVLDLSSNKFSSIHLQHMLQSIKNILYLNLSSNPIEQVNGMSEGPLVIQNNLTGISFKLKADKNENDEILCIDALDLKNCKIRRIPHLLHVCINSIDLQSNLLVGHSHLIVSNYSLYFLDYINLESNNITYIEFFMSGVRYKQDNYAIQNSPNNYFYGRTNTTGLNHTYINIHNNQYFKCDCNLVKTMDQIGAVRIVNGCFDDDFYAQCRRKFDERSGVRYLNRKLRMLFVITCLVLSVLSMLIIYYMCSDFVKSLKPYERVRLGAHRLLVYANLKSKYDPTVSANANKNIGVQYKRLVNDGSTVSHIEING